MKGRRRGRKRGSLDMMGAKNEWIGSSINVCDMERLVQVSRLKISCAIIVSSLKVKEHAKSISCQRRRLSAYSKRHADSIACNYRGNFDPRFCQFCARERAMLNERCVSFPGACVPDNSCCAGISRQEMIEAIFLCFS